MINDEQRAIAQAAVLASIREGHSLSRASLDAGVTRQGVWKWRQADPYFAEAFLSAYEEGTDLYEDALRTNALIKQHPASIVYALKLRGRFSPQETGVGDGLDTPVGTVEELAAKALERGYVSKGKGAE